MAKRSRVLLQAIIEPMRRWAKRLAGAALTVVALGLGVGFVRGRILEAHAKRTIVALRAQGDPGCFAVLTGRAAGATMRCRIGMAEVGNVVQDFSPAGTGVVLMIGAMRAEPGVTKDQSFVAEGRSPSGTPIGHAIFATLSWHGDHPGVPTKLEIPSPSQDYPYVLWIHPAERPR